MCVKFFTYQNYTKMHGPKNINYYCYYYYHHHHHHHHQYYVMWKSNNPKCPHPTESRLNFINTKFVAVTWLFLKDVHRRCLLSRRMVHLAFQNSVYLVEYDAASLDSRLHSFRRNSDCIFRGQEVRGELFFGTSIVRSGWCLKCTQMFVACYSLK
jgi:hypothetical protein